MYEEDRSGSYCGKRIPLTMIIASDKSFVHIQLLRNLYYELSIFYSSYKKEWITLFAHVKIVNFLNGVMTFFVNKQNSAHYSFITNHSKHIHLHLLSNGLVNCSVIVKDGPVRFSSTLFDLSDRPTIS